MARSFKDKNRRSRENRKNARSDVNRRKERNFKRELAPESSARGDSGKISPQQLKSLEKLLEGIGTPEPRPLVPDDFQIEALKAIETHDVLVTAPTGSGKTWIAREEIRRLLADGKRAWYTTPLKALTNSKYTEFSQEFGAENVGILTGDRKENAVAPLIVGTTEIYRNQLFDSLRSGEQVNTDFVYGGRRSRSRLGRSDNFIAAAYSTASSFSHHWQRRRICPLGRRSSRHKR
jgi:superfamily II RNA helicase